MCTQASSSLVEVRASSGLVTPLASPGRQQQRLRAQPRARSLLQSGRRWRSMGRSRRCLRALWLRARRRRRRRRGMALPEALQRPAALPCVVPLYQRLRPVLHRLAAWRMRSTHSCCPFTHAFTHTFTRSCFQHLAMLCLTLNPLARQLMYFSHNGFSLHALLHVPTAARKQAPTAAQKQAPIVAQKQAPTAAGAGPDPSSPLTCYPPHWLFLHALAHSLKPSCPLPLCALCLTAAPTV